MLPFGLRSAPKIFSAVADGLQWILVQKGVTHLLHFLDDFIFVAASPVEALTQKDTLVSTCSQPGIPLEMSKLEGPTTCLTFLCIEVNTVAQRRLEAFTWALFLIAFLIRYFTWASIVTIQNWKTVGIATYTDYPSRKLQGKVLCFVIAAWIMGEINKVRFRVHYFTSLHVCSFNKTMMIQRVIYRDWCINLRNKQLLFNLF